MNNRLIKSNDAGGGGCTNTVDLYNPFPDGGGVALYQLNGDATDVSGNYDAIDVRGLSYVDGVFGQAASFASNGNFNTGYSLSGSYTISFWCKNTASGYDVFNTTNSSGDNGIIFRGLRGGAVGFIDKWGGGGNYAVHTYTYPQDTNWHHFVLSFTNNNNCKIYFDGALILDFNSAQSTFINNTSLNFGEGLNTGNNPTGINLDQVRIFSRALRPYEVEALYTEEYCTPTIVPSEHFNTVTYTGDGTTNNPITSVGFQPDLVWIKNRDYSGGISHQIFDSVRGDTAGSGGSLSSNNANAEYFDGTKGVKSFNLDGFTLDGGVNGQYGVNGAPGGTYGSEYVAWNFKAGGAAVTNTDGTITSQVSANTEAGFSVVSYTGNGTQPSTIGHGLDSAPKIVINKCRSLGGTNWHVYSSDLGATSALVLNDTAAAYTGVGEWGSEPSSSVLYVNNTNTNFSGRTYISYCFAEVEGFSNFGSYVGTGASGNTIVTGFEPAFVMIKRTDAAASWYMIDNKRSPENVRDRVLFANLSNAEQQGQSAYYYPMNFLENGFELTQAVSDGYNANGGKYIYMAFAADPTTIEPSLEDSFNTVLYTGNGGTQSVTGVGFEPSMVWSKSRSASGYWHVIADAVRGGGNTLASNETAAERTGGRITSFDNDGFTVNVTPDVSANANGVTYVAWNWKGAELPAINSNGSIKSVVSANPAAGFSIVSYTGNSTDNATVGHGLSDAPSIVIVKARSATYEWCVGGSTVGEGQNLYLNSALEKLTRDRVKSVQTNTFTLGSHFEVNTTENYIAYCFAEVAGFSKFGSYVATNAAGNFQDCGFEPAFVMIKQASGGAGGSWWIFDNKRTPSNPRNLELRADGSFADYTLDGIDFLPTGFEFNNSYFNDESATYIYMAFANQF